MKMRMKINREGKIYRQKDRCISSSDGDRVIKCE